MPSRTLTLTIVVFWLGTSIWMFYRDIWPRWSDAPVPFRIDLEDEVGARILSWTVFQDGKKIGVAHTEIRRRPDRTYDLRSEYRFDGLRVAIVQLKKLTNQYTITASGELRELAVVLKLGDSLFEEGKLCGTVKDGLFYPKLFLDGVDCTNNPLFKVEPVQVSARGAILNPMHPLNKLSGLRAGQRWTVPYVHPLAVAASLGGKLPIGYLEATVELDRLQWHEEETACWRIEYAEAGKKASARTWVRQTDNTVLQQEASHQGTTVVMQRDRKR